MQAKIQRWGNSLALRIPRYIANQIQLINGSEVDISLDEEKIVITPVQEREDLETLLAGMTDENIHSEADFGDPAGGEIW